MSMIVVKASAIHNRGVYALCDISAGTKIVEYRGEKITKQEAERRGDLHVELAKADPSRGEVYIMELNDEFDVDGDIVENDAKYINHSCDPNCRELIEGETIWIVATRDIKKGQELVYNYRFGLENFQDSPCRCGSARCFGYILDEEDWPAARKILEQQKGVVYAVASRSY